MTLSAVPTGLKQLVRALFPSLERLGYCHSVPLGQQDLLILLGALKTNIRFLGAREPPHPGNRSA